MVHAGDNFFGGSLSESLKLNVVPRGGNFKACLTLMGIEVLENEELVKGDRYNNK